MTLIKLFEKKWFIPLIAAVLGFSGAMGGSIISGVFQSNQWDKQMAYEKQKTILEQRIKLLDRLSRVANSAFQMTAFNGYLRLQADLAKNYETCMTAKEKGCIKQDEAQAVVGINTKRTELNSEYASTIQLIKLYFSPQILPALNDLVSREDWWAPDVEPKFRALIKAASKEIEAL